MDYRSFLTKHRMSLEERHAANDDLRPADILVGVNFDEDNRLLFKWAKRERLISDHDIRDARRRADIANALGAVPKTPSEFVDLVTRQMNVLVKFNGEATCMEFETGWETGILSSEIARDCRIMNASLRAGFNRADIDDAAERWFQSERQARVNAIRSQIALRSAFDWELVARTCFDCSQTSPAFVAALLRKFVHQVVSKLNGRPVGDHLMLVLTGGQGIGKTYFLNQLFGPMLELSRNADFKAISDERQIDLWRSYIIFIDEMGYADRSDVDVVKNVITAETLDRRPMRTNASQTVRQSATMIGASNKRLGELIRDETGNRRFVGIEYTPPADRDFIASLDWVAAWQSVKHTDADPLIDYRDLLRTVQEQDRHYGPVEFWLRALASGEAGLGWSSSGKFRPRELYETYLNHRRTVTADFDPTPRTFDAFSKETGRIISDYPDICPLIKSRDSEGIVWSWLGPKPLTLVMGSAA